MGAEVPRPAGCGAIARKHAAPIGAAASRGSPYDKDNAEWILAQLKSYGLDAQIEVFDTLFPTPSRACWNCWGPTKFQPSSRSRRCRRPDLGAESEQLPTYNAYSIDGDVTAPVVYVNYGTPADYEQLRRWASR